MSKFAECFRRVIATIDPYANSRMTKDTVQIKLLADWGRKACGELEKHRWVPVSEEPTKYEYIIMGHATDFIKYIKVIYWDGSDEQKILLAEHTHWKPITLPEADNG